MEPKMEAQDSAQIYKERIGNILKATDLEYTLEIMNECGKTKNNVKECFTDVCSIIIANIQFVEMQNAKQENNNAEALVSGEEINEIRRLYTQLETSLSDATCDETCTIEDAKKLIAMKLEDLHDAVKKIESHL
jgi:hypothetical protein